MKTDELAAEKHKLTFREIFTARNRRHTKIPDDGGAVGRLSWWGVTRGPY